MAAKPEPVKRKGVKSVKWSADDISTFLETYINFEILWNTRNPDYANQTKRTSSMLKLQSELKGLGIEVPDLAFLRARIKTIKTTYRSELSKVNDSKKTGASTDETYVPKLQWFTIADSFLRDVAITRNSKSNLDTPTTSKEEMNITTADAETEEGAIEDDEGAIDDPHEENTTKSDAGADFQKPRTKIRRVTKLARIESTVAKLQQITANNRTSTTSNVSTDEVDLFGKYVAAQLKELPLRNRLNCQENIQSMLTKERLSLLASPEPPLSSPSPMLSGKSSYGNLSDDDDDYTTEQQTYTSDGPYLYRQLK